MPSSLSAVILPTTHLCSSDGSDLKSLLREGDERFWPLLCERSCAASSFTELLSLSRLRVRSETAGTVPGRQPGQALRMALIGGCSLYPLSELVEHLLAVNGFDCDIFLGEFDNYAGEMLDSAGNLAKFRPEAVLVIPSEQRCMYTGSVADSRAEQQAAAAAISSQLLEMCRTLHQNTGAEILLCNFLLPTGFDPGAYRTRTFASDWSFRKLVNLELGIGAPSFVHICDLEFLAYRRGGVNCRDDRAWFESKQPAAADFLADMAHETAALVRSFRKGPKKVLVADLDNTLWGGVVGDDGLEGIEIGDTSPRGEAFKAFQKYLRALADRGVLLAVCSKNDHEKAMQPFHEHPEMVLRLDRIACFKANWQPKSENLREIAAELGLGLDSLVFIDDNPAEIEIVRQFAPEVTSLLLPRDPADYVRFLQDSRLFEPRTLTAEDLERTRLYARQAESKALAASVTDMDSYLESLGMSGVFREFVPVDVPRVAQLINKSNQFNVTTRRRTESEVMALCGDSAYECFSFRLADRFGEHGLISVVIAKVEGRVLQLDTWLMSCRVLNRYVENAVMNEIVRLARLRGCEAISGIYEPTARNGLVRDLFPRMGFQLETEAVDRQTYTLLTENFEPFTTRIRIERRTHE